MIHELGKELLARLIVKGCPLTVVDGPEQTKTTTWGRERIVIEHDTDASASFGPAISQHRNPKHRHTVNESYKLTIYAKSAAAGATVFEHRRRATNVRNIVVSAMDYVTAVRKNRWEPTSGAFITPADLTDSEKPGGAVYELKFTYVAPIEERTWASAIAAEATLGANTIGSTTRVSLSHGEDDDDDDSTVPATAELACGA